MIKNLLPDVPYFSLDDPELRNAAQNDARLFMKRILDAENSIIIDRIQYTPALFFCIKMKVDENPKIKGRFILTGSQYFLIIKNLSETLAGRIGLINVYPLSADILIFLKQIINL